MSQSNISKQAEKYAEVIVGQIADNFQQLNDNVASCSKLKETLDEYKKAHNQSKWAKFIFEKNIDEYIGYVDEAKKETGCEDYNRIEPLAVGLFGEWGSGKTHQLKLIKHNILYPPKNIDFPQTTIPVFFNAWRFEKEEHMILPLFQTLLQAVEDYEFSLEEKGAKGYRTLSMYLKLGLLSLNKGLKKPDFISAVKQFNEGEYQKAIDAIINTSEIKKEIEKKKSEETVEEQTLTELLQVDKLDSIYLNIPQWIEKIALFENVNFVFLIDDLDRCLPENTLKMLESIKLFLDVPSCAFVLAVDDDVVERGVVYHYRDYLSIYHHKDTEDAKDVLQHELPITGHEYLEKMIQLPIRLPVISTRNVRDFLVECSTGWIEIVDTKYESVITLDLESKKRNAGKLRKQSEFLLDFFASTIPPKPRKIKRTALLFESKLKLLEKLNLEMDSMVLAKITLLELFAPKLLRFIQNNGYSSIFNALCHFRNVSYKISLNATSEIEKKVPDMEEYKNSLIEIDIIQKYIKEGIDSTDFVGYTPKEKDLYLKLMHIVYEHYNSRTVFNLDDIFRETVEIEQLTRILELRDVSEKIIVNTTTKKSFNDEFYQRLFRDGDVDAWRDVLAEYRVIFDDNDIKELIHLATDSVDKTFNELPFIANPQWVGEVAKYVDEEGYRKLIISSHKARFQTFDEENKKQIDSFQLTFAEYDKYCEITGKEKPKDKGWGRGRRPVIHVSWDDVQKYIDWLNTFLGEKDRYRLLQKEEWEWACNNGDALDNDKPEWYFGDDRNRLKEYAWYNENSNTKTHPVGELKANELGLFDMHGNVWEWCEDWYDGDEKYKVLKGGSWINNAHYSQTANSFRYYPRNSFYSVGFRLHRTLH